jgi:hypothetical protein
MGLRQELTKVALATLHFAAWRGVDLVLTPAFACAGVNLGENRGVMERLDSRLRGNDRRRKGEKEMKSGMKAVFVLAVVAAFGILGIAPALSQDKPADNMEILLEKIRADKKLLVAANMELTEQEAKAFWPLYQKYQDELFLLRARTARLIKDYSDSYKDMKDEKAKALLDESITIESLGLKLRQAYLPKFRKAIPEKKVARYYQIENKIQATLNYELAKEIPLVQ